MKSLSRTEKKYRFFILAEKCSKFTVKRITPNEIKIKLGVFFTTSKGRKVKMMLNKNYNNTNLCILVRSGRDYDSDYEIYNFIIKNENLKKKLENT